MKQFYLKSILCILLAYIGMAAFAWDCEVNSIYYNLNHGDHTASVARFDNYDYKGSITIPETIVYNKKAYNVTTIGSLAFYFCRVTSISIPNSVTSIENQAFYGCSNLTSINIPNNVTSIGDGSFSDCSSLTSISIPNSVTNIGGQAFQRCSSLTSINIPNNVTTIEDGTFEYCKSLTTINIPNNVTSIGESAFEECSSLTSINIPNNVTSIGRRAFMGCYGLEKIEVEAENPIYDSRDNCNAIIMTKQDSLMFACKKTTIPNGIRGIGNNAFYGCSDITFIEIPSSVTSIGDYAFYGCGFSSIILPEKLESIGTEAFSYCSKLTAMTLPDKLRSLGEKAFNNCSNLISIYIPESLKKIEPNIVQGCEKLESIDVAHGNKIYDSRKKCNAVILTAYDSLIIGCKNTTIPNSVKGIGASAFAHCIGLTTIDIPNSVKYVGKSAFWDCSNLASVTLSEGLEHIGSYAFSNDYNLKTIIIPNSIKNIEDYAFWETDVFIICNNPVPPVVQYSAFNPTSYYSKYERKRVAIVPESLVSAYKETSGWGHCIFNVPFVASSTETTITLVSSDIFSNVKAVLGDNTYVPLNDTIKITGLTPNTSYEIKVSGNYGALSMSDIINVTTQQVFVDIYTVEKTNTTITLRPAHDIGDVVIEENGFEEYETELSKNEWGQTLFKIKGLKPGTEYDYTYYFLSSDGYRFTQKGKFTTKPVEVKIKPIIGASYCELATSLAEIDATIIDYGFIDYPQQLFVKLMGLDPETIYTKTFYVDTQEGGRATTDVVFTTLPLTLTTSAPKVVSVGNVIVAAESNLDDDETNVGFEWRRMDWTDDFASNTGSAVLYEGMMEGYIRNLNADQLWKVRPYYLSNSGTYYYGDWIGLDPSNTSYFEPSIHTYAKIEIEGNDALVKGYALGGTDKVTVQGFKYWKSDSKAKNREYGRHKAVSIPMDAMTEEVPISGAGQQMMSANLTGLDYNSTYCYVAFVTTSEGETFYGEEQRFTTGADPTGIGNITVAEDTVEPRIKKGIYTLQGVKVADESSDLKALPRGIYIVHGKKVLVR